MASRFGSHIRVWFLLVPVLAIAAMPAIPDRKLFEIPDAETESLVASVGQDRADAAIRSANDLFRRSFVDNGIVHRTLTASGNVGALNDGGFSSFAHTWTENFWLLAYRMIFRAMVMKMWIVGTLLFAFGMFIDGAARRKIKASAAGFVSPLSFHLAGHGLLLVTGTLFGVLVAPVPVLAGYWLAVAALLGALLWKAAESFQSSR
ncbi:DUF4400 domain-containing protein [Paraburkholderia sabiae]|uniref:DUF4400 domain-containing protein n=1 Tax=Paraburkholderia sabiae TaxID=273251 RepID=A0ABU9QJ76_9BURK|nr:DUF4400 domain-containing protein [Paraburkholderia sabiae]WJZ79746.1 DUF4400 domain-containing protein [Paraburkholderia sabiae]CAD6559382.1 hypothetical protein LMG24235_06657 [Paraburkholderia sabiae]